MCQHNICAVPSSFGEFGGVFIFSQWLVRTCVGLVLHQSHEFQVGSRVSIQRNEIRFHCWKLADLAIDASFRVTLQSTRAMATQVCSEGVTCIGLCRENTHCCMLSATCLIRSIPTNKRPKEGEWAFGRFGIGRCTERTAALHWYILQLHTRYITVLTEKPIMMLFLIAFRTHLPPPPSSNSKKSVGR